MKGFLAVAGMASALVLSGCGGGGGGDAAPPPDEPPVVTYPAAQVLANFVSGGLGCNYTTEGMLLGVAVTGSGTRTFSASASQLFEGQVALVLKGVDAGTLMVGSDAAPFDYETNMYWTTNYLVLGSEEDGAYAVATDSVTAPASVKVGDSGPLATLTLYAESAKATRLGTISATYAIEADTAPAAIFNLRSETYDTNGVLLETENLRLRMRPDGAVQLHSIEGIGDAGWIKDSCQS